MLKWSIRKVELPLKFLWKISRGEETSKTLYIVKLEDPDIYGEGEVSITGRYGQTAELIESQFEEFLAAAPETVDSIEEFTTLLDDQDLCTSLRFGLESAFMHYLTELTGNTLGELLALKKVNSIQTSFSIPMMDPGGVASFIEEYNLSRFLALKIKVGDESALDLVHEVAKHFKGDLRIDANEYFKNPDEVMKFSEGLSKLPIQFLEQPMPADCHEEYIELKKISKHILLADESLTNQDVTDYFEKRFHGVNIKLMKAGGYLTALRQYRSAKSRNLKVMLGCMVETTLGISSALNMAHGFDYYDLDGHLFFKKEPFGKVIEEKGRLFFPHLQ